MSNQQADTKPKFIYPTADSLKEAVDEIKTRLPIENSIELNAALGLYHNTLLAAINKE